MIDTAKIVFFSGTGCTALSADTLKGSLEKAGIAVFAAELKKQRDSVSELEADLLVIMYPVHDFDAPLPAYEYVEGLERASGQKVAIVPVSGGGEMLPNRACRLGVRTGLEKKGFEVVYESMIVMPSTVFLYTPRPVARALVEKLPSTCDAIASDLSKGTIHRIDPPLIDRLFSKTGDLMRGYWGRIRFSEKLRVDDTCTSCGLCARSCPRNNIDMIDGTPRFRTDCVMCGRCIYGCPNKAVLAGYAGSMFLKDGFSLDSYKSGQAPDISELAPLVKGFLWIGVRQYLFCSP